MRIEAVVSSPVGNLCIVEEDGAIVGVSLTDAPVHRPETPLIARCAMQLAAYFAGQLRVFDLPLAPVGTAFQQSVWAALRTIPYGETRSYGQVAQALGKPGAARAVGRANHENPLMIVIPCHRVVNADGTMGGYNGGVRIKEKLLALERDIAAGEACIIS